MKKIFRLSAIVAMLSMMATTSVVTSCSDDDDDDTTKTNLPVSKTFTVNMGGSNSAAGSFLSISSEKVYTANALGEGKDVEIVFDGTSFKSASESANSTVKANGLSAVISSAGANTFAYATSNGFAGTITVDAALGDAAKSYTVIVTKTSK